MPRKPRITIVGPGNLGRALALSLHRAGYRIDELVSREKPASHARASALANQVSALACSFNNAAFSAKLTWLSVPDRAISQCAQVLAARATWKNKIVLHSSGALGSNELEALRRRGAAVASLHPFMTFVPGSTPWLRNVPFAVEGDPPAVRAARRIVRDLGGHAFPVHNKDKAAYHAWGAFASPLVVALLVTAEKVAARAGVHKSAARKRMLPILQQTLRNYGEKGAAGAFSGPIIRGDAATVSKHLQILKKTPVARDVYLALARSALQNLPTRNRGQLTKLLER